MYDEKDKTRFRQFGFVSPIKQAPMCDEKGKTRFRLFGFVSPIKQAPSVWKIEELVVERKIRMNKKFSCLVKQASEEKSLVVWFKIGYNEK